MKDEVGREIPAARPSRRDFLGMSSAALAAMALAGLGARQQTRFAAELTKEGDPSGNGDAMSDTSKVESQSSGSFKGKVAVVTGAARGIGRATAVALAREGADVAGIDICGPVYPPSGVEPANKGELDETGKRVTAMGRKWLGLVLDQRDMPALRGSAVTVEQTYGGIDIVFANAGIQGFSSLLEMDDEHWHVHIDNNLTGTANMIRVFAPYLVKRKGGRIIVTSSTQGQHGTKYGSAYSASKWGIIGLMKSAALELGQYGITVNAVIPGLIDTALTRHEERYAQVLQEAGRTATGSVAKDEETARQILIARSPLGVPWIEPEDVAPVAVFLASDAARMVSGATFDATGGDSAHNTA